MKHKYLDIQANAKKLGWILAILALVSAVIGICLVKNGYTVWTGILFIISGLSVLFFISFLIHYLNHNNPKGVSYKKEVTVLHLTAMIVVFVVTILVASPLGAFSKAVLEGITDGLLVALSVLIIGTLLEKRLGIVAIIGGVIEGLLILFSQSMIAIVILFIVGLVTLAIVIWHLVSKHKNHRFAAYYLVASLFITALTLAQLINGNSEAMHMYLHFGMLIAPLALVAVFYGLVTLFESKDTKEEPASDKKSERIIKEYSSLSAKELLDAPVDALKGVSKDDAELLNKAFGIKTIGDFANNRFFDYATKIVEESKK